MASEVTLGSLASFVGHDGVPEEWVPAEGKFKAIIFDTSVPGPPEIKPFDSESEIQDLLAVHPGFT